MITEPQPKSAPRWVWPVDPMKYDQSHSLTDSERLTIYDYITQNRVSFRFSSGLSLLLLARRSPHPADLTTELLEEVRLSSINSHLKE